jgi:hypothetical protein
MRGDAPAVLTIENIDSVLAFLPVFERPGFSAGEIVSEKGKCPYVDYSPDVHAFIRTLYDCGWIRLFDWGSWQNEAIRYFGDSSQLDSADLNTLSKLLTLHVRKERFCEGNLFAMIENGYIVAILKRLRTIREEGSHQTVL